MSELQHITAEQIAEYGVVAAPDRLTGKANDNKMIFDRLVRELVAGVVNDIIDKTNELLTQEDTREENESDRIAAENLRVSAENSRIAAETERISAEEERENAEEDRESAETLRQQAETSRISAEQSRVSAEAQRVLAETNRESTTNGIVAQATTQAQAAASSAASASQSASAASSSAQIAQASETAASASAHSAEHYSELAAESDLSALSSKQNAEESRNRAELAAQQANASNLSALSYSQSASAYSSSANQYASNALASQKAIENMTVSVKTLQPGSDATVEKTMVGNSVNLQYGIPKGEKGDGFRILGYYTTLQELQSAVTAPDVGDAYGVGSGAPYDIYIWSGTGWVNNGPIQGAKGDPGEDGKSPYEVAVEGGFQGSESAFNDALVNVGSIGSVLDQINGEVI